jgi:uncharacterized radical SAM superfamily Fe-S cluster-containing enzyme
MKFIEIENIDQVGEPNKFGIAHPSKAIRMMNRIVLDITYECTLGCMNCNRFCGIFPRKNAIGISRIRNFIDSSINMQKKWFHIYIAGGEPSVHPRIDDIFLKKKMGIDRLEDVTFEKMAAILHQTCRYCGHYFEQLGYKRSSDLMVSLTWKQYLKEMKVIK